MIETGHSVVWCTPRDSQNGLKFDFHQFYDRARFKAPLAYSDLQAMNVKRVGDKKPMRRLETPEWSRSDELVREVIVAYLEGRSFQTGKGKGSLLERLEQCRRTAKKHVPAKKKELEDRIERYRELVHTPNTDALTAKKLRNLEVQIQNLDADIFLCERGPEIVNAVAYLYYRLGWDSVSVAEELRLKPPHVRQILHRMNRTWRRMQQNVALSYAGAAKQYKE